MAQVAFEGRTYDVQGQSLLDCLNADGQAIPNGCRAGVCQACLMRVVRGAVPARAQEGLPPTFVARGLFLACQCHLPHGGGGVASDEETLEVALADDVLEHFDTVVRSIEALNENTRALRLQAPASFAYRAGQFLQLFQDDRTMRNYSLASVPCLDPDLVLHVRRIPGGRLSGWIFDRLEPGDRVRISEARGNCIYVPGTVDQGLLLIGTGSGLAPLYGIARDALHQGHRGLIRLYHGSRAAAGLYLGDDLNHLAAAHPNFHYEPCISGASSVSGRDPVAALDRAMRDQPDLSGWRVYLCGNPQMVEAARLATFLAGAASSDILADPFLPTGTAPTQSAISP